jgi:hypothetical protein
VDLALEALVEQGMNFEETFKAPVRGVASNLQVELHREFEEWHRDGGGAEESIVDGRKLRARNDTVDRRDR